MTKHLKTIEQQYQVLTDIEHLRKRISIYAGSPILEERSEYLFNPLSKKMELSQVSFIPALIKALSEAIDNVVDEHKRNPVTTNQLKVDISGDDITIWNNGGIPVAIHKELNQYVPEIIFGTLRSSSNYNDDEDQSIIGTNGVGVKILNAVSEYFIVETADGKNSFKQEYTDGMNSKSNPIIKPSSKSFTQLSFKPDLKYFNIDRFDENHVSKVLKRLIDVSACNPNLKIYFNGELIRVKDFSDYINLYYDDVVYNSNGVWEIGLASCSGYSQTSFVNSVETYMGGTHVDYALNQIILKLREFFKKKHKIDVKPSDIKSHLHLFVNCSVNRPKFSSQTKENMITPQSDFNDSWECSDAYIKKVIGLDAIQNILDWVKAKEQANLAAELRKHNKAVDKSDPKNVPKFHDATSKNREETILLIVEGDSALAGVLSGRNTKLHGAFPLKGKPINVFDMDIKDVMLKEEFKNLLTIIGLQLGVPVNSVSDIRFGKIVITTDQDLDGFNIRSLLFNMFYKYWPELFSLGIVCILNTPIVKVTYKKKQLCFYTIEEFELWKSNNPNAVFDFKYYKGLGTSSSKEWKEYFSDDLLEQNLITVTPEVNDFEMFKLLFSKEKGMTHKRKEWMNIGS